jgi:hypothetical protein
VTQINVQLPILPAGTNLPAVPVVLIQPGDALCRHQLVALRNPKQNEHAQFPLDTRSGAIYYYERDHFIVMKR